MKFKIRKKMALALAMIMVLAMGTTVFAATQNVPATPADTDNATITINNPSKGETYSAVKLFDATTTSDGKISYQGTVPDGLGDYFEETSSGSGYVQAKPAAFKTVKYYADAAKTQELAAGNTSDYWTGEGMSEGLEAALETWVNGKTATATGVSDGSEALAFTALPYGYYVITTSHEDDEQTPKGIITVDSTNPTASVYDKNVNVPTAEKTVEEVSYSIGDTVKYKADFATTNYLKDDDGKSWQVIEYTISDTLPAFLDATTVTVTKLTIDGTDYKVSDAYPQFTDKKIVIPWATKGADDKYTNSYANGVVIHIEYQATLTEVVKVEADNKNVISITPKVTDDEDTPPKPWEENWHDDAVIKTYATALKKTDGTNALAGAKFKVPGLVAEKGENGVYTVVSYNPDLAANVTTFDDTDMTDTNSTTLEVDENGMLYIIGIAEDVTLDIWEVEAPAGYNQLTTKTSLPVEKLTEEVFKLDGYRKYDADGNIIEEAETVTGGTAVEKNLDDLNPNAVEIVNKQGTELPSTGGIGTTIFYIVGVILVLGAGILLVTRRRMNTK